MQKHNFTSTEALLFLKNIRRIIIPALVFIFVGFASLVYPSKAHAYDEDIHFYMTYTVARYVGIDHYTALYLGAGSQWIDVSAISSPMNPLALIGTRMRRSNHFPSHRRKVGTSMAHGLGGLSFFSETRPNHPFGSDGIMAGMKLGDLMRVSYSIHRWQDTYAHAGNTAEFGHGLLGHQPDRFFLETDKTKDMIRGLTMLLVRIRSLLPTEALDLEFRDGGEQAHAQLDADTLSDRFLAREDVSKILSTNYLVDERYTRYSVNYLLAFYQKRGLIHPDIDFRDLLERLERKLADEGVDLYGSNDVRSILKTLFLKATELELSGIDVINDDLFEQILVGYPDVEYSLLATDQGTEVQTRNLTLWERIDKIGRDQVVDQLVSRLTANVIPEAFSEQHKVEFEVEGPIRSREHSVRRRDFRDLIQELYGRNVKFYEMRKVPSILQAFGKLQRVFSKAKREAYLEEKLAEEVGESIRAEMPVSPQGDKPEIATLPPRDRWLYIWKHLREDWFDLALYYASFGKKGNHRFVAQSDSILWQFEDQFEVMRQGGVVKPLITAEQHAELVKYFSEIHRAYSCGELLVK